MQLISRSQAKDAEAFAALFEKYKNLVYRTAYLMLDDASEAEEALQEVFVLVYKSLEGFDPSRGAFTTWLYRVTIHYCLNHRRKRRIVAQPLEDTSLAGLDPDLAAFAQKDEIRQAIARLNENQRAVIILRYYGELPYAEIAQSLDVPVGTIKSRLDRSLRALRQLLVDPDEAAALSSEENVTP